MLARWGEPQQDPMFRDGRMMVAGLRYGLTFVGIQPARGYQLDPAAVYHDPDLVPPHGYLAFYFWLRHAYRADALLLERGLAERGERVVLTLAVPPGADRRADTLKVHRVGSHDSA